MLRGASKPARGGGGMFDAGGDRPLSRRQRRKRQLVLDVFVFVFVGVWIGFAVHSQFTVGRLHEVSDSRKGVRTMVIQDNGPKQHGVNEETAVASRGEASASSPGKALSSAGWEWDQISGLFGGGGGLREPDRSVRVAHLLSGGETTAAAMSAIRMRERARALRSKASLLTLARSRTHENV